MQAANGASLACLDLLVQETVGLSCAEIPAIEKEIADLGVELSRLEEEKKGDRESYEKVIEECQEAE